MNHTIKIPFYALNNEVAELLYGILVDGFKKGFNAVTIQVSQLITLEFKKAKVSQTKGDRYASNSETQFTLISSKLKDVLNNDTEKRLLYFANLITEGVVDNWLKYKATYFFCEFDIEDKGQINIWFNVGFSTKELQAYWHDSYQDGWDVKGNFLKREWRGVPTGAGRTL